jgi:hypothetical protein
MDYEEVRLFRLRLVLTACCRQLSSGGHAFGRKLLSMRTKAGLPTAFAGFDVGTEFLNIRGTSGTHLGSSLSERR